MKTILKCNNITKKIGDKTILDNISINIDKGDILAFIGPNGCGKTTTIKLILGLQSATEGSITINGFDIKNDFVKAIEKVGAIVENPDSYMHLTGLQNLKLIKNSYKNISDNDIYEVINLVKLESSINEKVSTYSLGMRQRLGLAKALLNKPDLLILDEPTNGLDPEGIRDLRNLLKNLASNGVGILISSHNLAELESFCNKICIIEKGKIIETNSFDDFKNENNEYILRLSKTNNITYKNVTIKSNNEIIYKGSKNSINNLLHYLIKKNIKIYELKSNSLSLEEAFLNKTGGKND